MNLQDVFAERDADILTRITGSLKDLPEDVRDKVVKAISESFDLGNRALQSNSTVYLEENLSA